MLVFKSKSLKPQLLEMYKKVLGKTGARDTTIQFTSTTNGLEIILNNLNWGIIRFYDEDAELIEDGSSTFILADMLELLNFLPGDEFELSYNGADTQNSYLLNEFPLISVPNVNKFPNTMGSEIKISLENEKKIIKQLTVFNKDLKKSIFPESVFLELHFDKNLARLTTISPLKQHTEDIELQDTNVNNSQSSLYLSKLNIKMIKALFSKSSVNIISTDTISKIANQTYEYIIPEYNVRSFIFHPTMKNC